MIAFLYLHDFCFSALLGELVLLFFFLPFSFVCLDLYFPLIYSLKKVDTWNIYNVEDHILREHYFPLIYIFSILFSGLKYIN